MNKAFKVKNIEPVIGHKKSRVVGCDSFDYLPEGEIFVESGREINLVNESLQICQPIEETQMSVSASWISIQGMDMRINSRERIQPHSVRLSNKISLITNQSLFIEQKNIDFHA